MKGTDCLSEYYLFNFSLVSCVYMLNSYTLEVLVC